ncbi:MAG: efflux RND transporter periplasmic adaptor subunit [Verrucomicrobiales bacterium]|nr:efflux RND transporter periplasmic adaptor subunit [Verrucomicrobiales bacterium]
MPTDCSPGPSSRRLLAALVLGAWASLHGLAAAEPPASAPAKPVSVAGAVVEERRQPEWSEFHGFVRSRNKVDVIAQVMGRVKAVHVQAGQKVAAGDLLLELDSDEWKAKLAAAESHAAAAEAVEVEAGQFLTRIQTLFPQGAATREELDAAIARQKSAHAAVEAARAQVKESRELLRYSEVRSPIRGIVVDKRVNPGDFSVPGLAGAQGFASGATLMTIYDPDALWFECAIPERHASSVTVGTQARILLGPSRTEVEGRFVEVVPGVDDVARTFIGRIDLPASSELKLGMFGRVRFPTGERWIVDAPAHAIVPRGQLDTVFVVESGKARLRLVRTGRPTERGLEILSGLKAGERVIVNPPQNLRDGDPVTDEGSPK